MLGSVDGKSCYNHSPPSIQKYAMYDYWYSYKVKYNKKDTNDVKVFRWDYHVYFHIPYLERILQNQLINKKLT